MNSFGEKLREERRKRNWTQEEFGARVGLQKSAIAKYENGRILNVTTEIIERFAAALGVSPYDLMDSFERGLYALDYVVSGSSDGVRVSNPLFGGAAFFAHEDWAEICSKKDYDLVRSAVERAENKKAPDTFIDAEDLSEDKRYLIKKIMSLSDDEVRGLRAIVDQVLALRG